MDAQSRIQGLVNSLGEGWGQALLRLFIAATLLLLVFLAYAGRQFVGLRDARSMESAQVAHNLAEGRGFTTTSMRPADLGYLARAGRSTDPGAGIPDLRQAPAYPALLAAGFRVFAPSWRAPAPGDLFAPETRVILPLGFVCTLLTGLLILIVGSRLFDMRVGVVAFIAFSLSDSVLRATIGGGVTPLAMLLTTLSLALALAAGGLRARQSHPTAWVLTALLAGAVAGLAVLTSYALIVVPVVAVGVLASGFVRWRAGMVILFLLAATLVVAPWVARNLRVCGQPFGLAPHAALNETRLFPGDAWDRTYDPRSDSRDVVRALKATFTQNLATLYSRELPTLGEGLVFCFFALALFMRFENERVAALKWGVVGALVLIMLGAACWRADAETLLPLLPLVVLLGAAALYRLLDDAPFLAAEMQGVVAAGWVALAALPALLTLVGPAARWTYPPYAPTLIRYVSGLMQPGEVLATDIPEGVAWYGGRAALRIPVTTDVLVDLRDKGVPLGGVYLTTVTGDQPYRSVLTDGAERSWRPLLDQLVPENFPWQHGIALPPGTRDQIVLTDAAHWPE